MNKETISLDFLTPDGEIKSPYIGSVKFSILDSLTFPDMDPDKMKTHTTPVGLDFSKKIEPYSPEYYTAYTLYYIIKTIENYNRLFDNRIDFDFEEEYRDIEICFGDFPGITHPNFYILEKGSNPSPSLFYHEIGHRAFWYMEDPEGLNVRFKGLSAIHMGLLEYFTVSFNDSSIIGEDCLPPKLIRDASVLQKYPFNDSLKLRRTLELMEASYPEEMKNPESNVAKDMAASYAAYDSDMLDNIYDNHRVGMVLTSTLWRIRQTIGREKTDKLVAQTILNLNEYMEARGDYCDVAFIDSLKNRIEWCDVFYGLIRQDKAMNGGENIQVFIDEFKKTGYPVDWVKEGSI